MGLDSNEKSMSLNVPDNLKYAKSHEWLKVDGETGVIGITDHAQNELTDVVFAELPEVGRVLSAGEACAVVEVKVWAWAGAQAARQGVVF